MAGLGLYKSLVRVVVQLPVGVTKISATQFRKAPAASDAIRDLCVHDLKGSNIYKLNGDLVGHRMHAGLRSVWTKRPTSYSRQPDLPNFQLANSSTALSSSRLKVKK